MRLYLSDIQCFDEFQSLSGFQVHCNYDYCQEGDATPDWFQSLSGFQVHCNTRIR